MSAPPPAALPVRPRWSRTIDGDRGGFLPNRKAAVGDSLVAFRFHGRICGFSADTGQKKWCAGPGDGPVFAAHEFAYTDTSNVIHGIDAKSGAVKWSYSFRSLRAVSFPGALAWPARDDFFIARVNEPGVGVPNFGEISEGHLLWSSRVPGYYAGDDGPVVFGSQAIEGFASVSHAGPDLEIVRLGHDGGVQVFVRSGGWVVGGHPPLIYLGGRWRGQTTADIGLTFEVRSLDLRNSKLGQVFQYQPDYSQNYERIKYTFDWMRGPTPQAHVIKVENGYVYGSAAGNLYRYALADASTQHPLRIPGAYLSGPTAGMIYVSRSDGIWTLRIGPRFVRAQLVVPMQNAIVQTVATFGAMTYMGFSDGRLVGVNQRDGRISLQSKTCHAVNIQADGKRVFVTCYFDFKWQIAVF